MDDAELPEVAARRLDRHTKLLLAGLAALFATALLGHAIASAVTEYLFQTARIFLFLALAMRVGRHFEHTDRVLRWSSWLALVCAFGAILVPPSVGVPASAVIAAVLVVVGWSAISLARRRWLAQATAPRGTTLSVAVICKDEVDRIGRLLEAVKGWADEIVVLDSGSRDGTVALAQRYTDRVEVTDWPGYGAQKQRALERCRSEWVLSLDADEVPSAAFKREVDAWLAARSHHDGFKAHWVSIVFGGPIDFGADGRYHTRLLRRRAARFDGAAVHEEALVAGEVATLESPVYHYTFRDADHMARKFDEYAWLSARARFAKGKRATELGAWVRGAVSFLLLYFVRLGVLDGWRGLRMAARYARYTHDKYAFLRALAHGSPG